MAAPRAIKELTVFKINCLAVLSDSGETYGLAIKSELEEAYEKEVNHGRLYPNLDYLVDQGYVEKGEIDKRTNSYKLTKQGERILNEYVDWLNERT